MRCAGKRPRTDMPKRSTKSASVPSVTFVMKVKCRPANKALGEQIVAELQQAADHLLKAFELSKGQLSKLKEVKKDGDGK